MIAVAASNKSEALSPTTEVPITALTQKADSRLLAFGSTSKSPHGLLGSSKVAMLKTASTIITGSHSGYGEYFLLCQGY